MLQKEILEVKEIVRAHQGNESRVENCAEQILFQNFLIMEALIEFNNYRILAGITVRVPPNKQK